MTIAIMLTAGCCWSLLWNPPSDVLIELFERVGLRTNTEKTKVMTCTPRSIRSHVSESALKRRHEGGGESYRAKKRRRSMCPLCDKDLAVGSLPSHLRSQHGQDATGNIALAPGPRNFATYSISPPTRVRIPCPVEGCSGGANNGNALRRHFNQCHPDATIINRREASYAFRRCEHCGLQCSPNNWKAGHRDSKYCMQFTRVRLLEQALRDCQAAKEVTFTASGDQLSSVEVFRYLGRLLSATDNDWPALHRNLAKARQRWAMISRVLAREGASPRVSGMFYKAVVQAVLLYGSETWVFTQSMYKALAGFHHRVARRLAGRMPRLEQGQWVYPPIQEALEAAGLFPMEEYITRRRNRMVDYVATRPILDICEGAMRKSGTPTGTRFWWQGLDLQGD